MLAKSVKGLNEEICDGLRGVMLDGAALTIEANKEKKIKPPASIVHLCFEDGLPRTGDVEKSLVYISPLILQSVLREQLETADILEIKVLGGHQLADGGNRRNETNSIHFGLNDLS